MQNEICQLLTSISPQTLGMTDSASILGFYLFAPGALMFAVLYFGRELLRPRWRGYWTRFNPSGPAPFRSADLVLHRSFGFSFRPCQQGRVI